MGLLKFVALCVLLAFLAGCSAPPGKEGFAYGFKYVDLVQVAFWFVGALGVIYTIFKGLKEIRDATESRRADHRWRQASFAMDLIKELQADTTAKLALDMIDYSGKYFAVPGFKRPVYMDYARMVWGLRTEPLDDLDHIDEFIRSSFDALFEHVARMRWAVASRLVEFEDVSRVLEYYIECVCGDPQLLEAVENYMKEFNYGPELHFLNRFKLK